MISLRDVVTGFGVRDPLAEVWRRSLRGGGGGAAEITGVPPLRYIGDGRPLTDYMLYGNTIQNGTPSPEAPVDATGCGVWDETRQSYKLPLTVNGTEYPIYLGQVESTRRVKKLVLDGTEDWRISGSGDSARFYINIADTFASSSLYCTHFTNGVQTTSGNCEITASKNLVFNNSGIATTTSNWKTWLSTQYANGTPVTVWYVLAEPETAIVNEPLMKIGDYADTISFTQSGVAIPTVNGENVLDMTFPVKPSEVYIKGKGIKPTGYGQLVDKNGVRILDKNDVRILVHGQ